MTVCEIIGAVLGLAMFSYSIFLTFCPGRMTPEEE
jgi:hypothetical protein